MHREESQALILLSDIGNPLHRATLRFDIEPARVCLIVGHEVDGLAEFRLVLTPGEAWTIGSVIKRAADRAAGLER